MSLLPIAPVVEGFRKSAEAVAAFRFGPVRESYAQEKYRRHPQCRRDRDRDLQRTRDLSLDRPRSEEAPAGRSFPRPVCHSALTISLHRARWRAPPVVVSLSRPPMPKFFIKTYGCQMNERDSEQVARSLVARGYELTRERDGGRRRAAQYLQRARHGGAEGARQNGDARPVARSNGRRWSSVFSAAWRRARGAELVKRSAACRSRGRHAEISSRGGLRGRVARAENARCASS